MSQTPTKYFAHSADQEKGVEAQLYGSHILNVLENIKKSLVRVMRYSKPEWRNTIRRVIAIAGEYHDLGKLDDQAQDVLAGKINAKMINHVDAGVAFAEDQFKKTGREEWLLVAALIHAHHISLVDEHMLFDHGASFDSTIKLAPQIRSNTPVSEYGIDSYDKVKEHVNKNLSKYVARHNQCLHDILPVFKSDLSFSDCDMSVAGEIRKSPIAMKILLSVLCNADHQDTSMHYKDNYPDDKIGLDVKKATRVFRAYLKDLRKKSPKTKRNLMRANLANRSWKIPAEARLAHIFGSVGSGKTYATLAASLSMAEHGGQDSINYMMPFTALIDQSALVYRKALAGYSSNMDQVVSQVHSCISAPSRWARRFAKCFNAPINVTTSVNAFDSILKNSTGRIRNIHKFVGSIIVLEEYHALAAFKHWPIIMQTLYEFVEFFSCKVILSSGTPIEFWNSPTMIDLISPEAIELFATGYNVVSENGYRNMVSMDNNRFKAKRICKDTPISFRTLKNRILKTKGNKFIIMNTKQKAARFAQYLAPYLGEKYDLFVRQAFLAPKDRMIQFEEVKKRLEDKTSKPIILIATQGADVGLDLSFDHGWKEESDYRSMIQGTGRINRHCELKSKSKFYIFRLDQESDDSSNDLLYDNPVLSHAAKSSRKVMEIIEKKGKNRSVIDMRYSNMATQFELDMMAEDTTEDMAHLTYLLQNRKYGTLGEDFSIIDTPNIVVLTDLSIAEKIVKGDKVSWNAVQECSVSVADNTKQLERLKAENKIIELSIDSSKKSGTVSTSELENQKHKAVDHDNLWVWNAPYDHKNMGILAGWKTETPAFPVQDWMNVNLTEEQK